MDCVFYTPEEGILVELMLINSKAYVSLITFDYFALPALPN